MEQLQNNLTMYKFKYVYIVIICCLSFLGGLFCYCFWLLFLWCACGRRHSNQRGTGTMEVLGCADVVGTERINGLTWRSRVISLDIQSYLVRIDV